VVFGRASQDFVPGAPPSDQTGTILVILVARNPRFSKPFVNAGLTRAFESVPAHRSDSGLHHHINYRFDYQEFFLLSSSSSQPGPLPIKAAMANNRKITPAIKTPGTKLQNPARIDPTMIAATMPRVRHLILCMPFDTKPGPETQCKPGPDASAAFAGPEGSSQAGNRAFHS
jgi:hypothetical protein